jgi:hypothetical protein
MNTRCWLRLVGVSVGLIVGCRSADKNRYQAVADVANAKISRLRDIVAPVLRPDVDDAVVVSACLQAEDIVRELQDVDFHDHDLSGRIGETDASAVVRTLIEMRRDKCQEDVGDGTRTRRCRNWCVDRWGRLADAVDRLHTAAKSEGVYIERLRATK